MNESPLREPPEILAYSIEKGCAKASLKLSQKILLGTLGGAYIALGYLAYLRAFVLLEGSGAGHILGSALFPLGLILLLLGGGELVTGNMMALTTACCAGKIRRRQLWSNWLITTAANALGALVVAYVFGHILGLTEGAQLGATIRIAEHKVQASWLQSIISGIGCNWLVGLAVWLCYASKDLSGKILGIWFPVMSFVLIGFQHVVANLFILPAALWAGANISALEVAKNLLTVWLGNAFGGAVLVAGIYYKSFRLDEKILDG